MNAALGIANLLVLMAFCFGLSLFLVHVSRLPGARRGLVLAIGGLVLVLVTLGELIYSGIPMVCGVGLALFMAVDGANTPIPAALHVASRTPRVNELGENARASQVE